MSTVSWIYLLQPCDLCCTDQCWNILIVKGILILVLLKCKTKGKTFVCVAIWKNICPNRVHDTFPHW
jgi:hypothetical protein